MSNITDFEKKWNKFITKLKGSLIELSEQQQISYANTSIIFDEVASCWSLSYDECGRWLADLAKTDARKGELVKTILTKDLKLEEIPTSKPFPLAARIGVPVIGAAVGFGFSHFLGAPIWGQIVSTAVPAVLLFPVMNVVAGTKERDDQNKQISSYIEQLDKYKKSIISVLETE